MPQVQDTPSAAIELSPDKPGLEAVDLLVELAKRRLALRQWERCNLPIDGSQLGFELFMALGPVWVEGLHERSHFLKQLYLTLPYSEKGVHLHLRRLELSGWLTVCKVGVGGRTSRVDLSPRYWQLMASYAIECELRGFANMTELF